MTTYYNIQFVCIYRKCIEICMREFSTPLAMIVNKSCIDFRKQKK